jgi:hypothetical protein
VPKRDSGQITTLGGNRDQTPRSTSVLLTPIQRQPRDATTQSHNARHTAGPDEAEEVPKRDSGETLTLKWNSRSLPGDRLYAEDKNLHLRLIDTLSHHTT